MPSPPSSDPRHRPPRLLHGVALLLWGGISGHALIGLALAFLVEAAHWTRIRWNFEPATYQRAWRVSLLLFLIVAALEWLGSSIITVMPRTFVWLPLILFPLQFVQVYGDRDRVPLTIFSHFLRKRKQHAERHGLPFREVRFHFGHTYFVLTVLSASLGRHAGSPIYFPAAAVLLAWLLHHRFARKPRAAPVSAAVILLAALAAGYGGERGLNALYRHLAFRHHDPNHLSYARETRTAIGTLGEIKQSPTIHWRVRPVRGEPPKRLRLASYNSYLNSYWSTNLPADVNRGVDEFTELDSYGIDDPFRITGRLDEERFLTGPEAAHDSLPRFTLRGSFPREGLFPLPGNATSLVQPNQNIEINPFGTLRLDPMHPVADALILFGDPAHTARAPWPARRDPAATPPDLQIPATEAPVLEEIVAELGLAGLPLAQKVDRIRRHFRKHFSYSRYLENPYPRSELERTAFVSRFLRETRRGHCEYFATATAFLLRASGTPARYATGFAVVPERPDAEEILVRGTHAHAWALAWDESRDKWIDVDLTPSSWIARETPRMPAWQAWLDRWQILRDDLLVWRTRPGNFALAAILMTTPVVIGALLVVRRLWRSKRRLDNTPGATPGRASGPPNALQKFEPEARKILGPRPPGMSLARWLEGLAPRLDEPTALRESIRLHRRLRFDPDAETRPLGEQLAAAVNDLARQTKRIPR